ncbi:MAG: hypothetical protein Q9199_003907 [Rusavskia elegans]
MAGRCRMFLRAVAGTLGLVATPYVAYQVNPSIMDHIEDFVAERITLTAKEKFPAFMPEIPFVPTATVKVEHMLDTEWAYYLGLLMLLVSFLPTIAQISKLLWNTRYYNECNDFIILGKTEESEPIDEDAMLPSAFKVASWPHRHRIRRELDAFIDANHFKRTFACSKAEASTVKAVNGALTTRTTAVNIDFPAFGGANINLTHLFHGSQAERLVFAVLLQYMFTRLLTDLALHQQFLGTACADLQLSNDAVKHLFMALSSVTHTNIALRQSSNSQSFELSATKQELTNEQANSSILQSDLATQRQINDDKDKHISDLRITQQQSDTKIVALTQSEEKLQIDNRANETVIKRLRAQLGEPDKKTCGPPTTYAGDDKPPIPTTRNPGRFLMGDVMRQKISDLEKENSKLKAQASACIDSAGLIIGTSHPSTHNTDKQTSRAPQETFGSSSTATPAPVGDPTAGQDSNPVAPGQSCLGRDEPVRIRSLKRFLQPPHPHSYTYRRTIQEHAQGDPSNDEEDETSQAAEATPTKSNKKKRRRRVRRKPNGQGANDGAAIEAGTGRDAQGGEDAHAA